MTTPVSLKERGDGDVKQLAEKKTVCGRDWNDDITLPEVPTAPRSWKKQESVPESLQREGVWSASIVTLAQEYWFRTSGLQNCEKVNFYCFKL